MFISRPLCFLWKLYSSGTKINEVERMLESTKYNRTFSRVVYIVNGVLR